MPSDISQKFFDLTAAPYEKFHGPDYSLKPMTEEEGLAATKVLADLVRSDSELSDAFEEASQEDIIVTVIDGIITPAIEDVPKSMPDVYKQPFIKT